MVISKWRGCQKNSCEVCSNIKFCGDQHQLQQWTTNPAVTTCSENFLWTQWIKFEVTTRTNCSSSISGISWGLRAPRLPVAHQPSSRKHLSKLYWTSWKPKLSAPNAFWLKSKLDVGVKSHWHCWGSSYLFYYTRTFFWESDTVQWGGEYGLSLILWSSRAKMLCEKLPEC